MDMADHDMMVRASQIAIEQYRKQLRSIGPRHRNADRWMFDLGWSISEEALLAYLAPELPRAA